MALHDEVWVETLPGEEWGGGGCVTIIGGCDEGKEGAEESWKWEVHYCIANSESPPPGVKREKEAMGDISWTANLQEQSCAFTAW